MNEQPREDQIRVLRQRLARVQEEIADAATRVGRSPDQVRLVGVTKLHPAEVLQAAVAAGMREIGENYVQEAEEKFTALGWPAVTAGAAPVVRHLIGPLQSNKARKALQCFEMIQTVDSVVLAERLERIAGELGRTVDILLQINISNEPTKSGFSPESLEGVFSSLANLSHIRTHGLMTIGRFDPDPEAARSEFIAMRALRDRLRAVVPENIRLDELSMGMSHDFAVAVEEGATIVRVGSRLFGPRGA